MLSQCMFTGTIPTEWLLPLSHAVPHWKTLSLHHNSLSGTLPSFLCQSPSLSYRYDGNDFLCPLPSCCHLDHCGACIKTPADTPPAPHTPPVPLSPSPFSPSSPSLSPSSPSSLPLPTCMKNKDTGELVCDDYACERNRGCRGVCDVCCQDREVGTHSE